MGFLMDGHAMGWLLRAVGSIMIGGFLSFANSTVSTECRLRSSPDARGVMTCVFLFVLGNQGRVSLESCPRCSVHLYRVAEWGGWRVSSSSQTVWRCVDPALCVARAL
jgi:hypothetical protein